MKFVTCECGGRNSDCAECYGFGFFSSDAHERQVMRRAVEDHRNGLSNAYRKGFEAAREMAAKRLREMALVQRSTKFAGTVANALDAAAEEMSALRPEAESKEPGNG